MIDLCHFWRARETIQPLVLKNLPDAITTLLLGVTAPQAIAPIPAVTGLLVDLLDLADPTPRRLENPGPVRRPGLSQQPLFSRRRQAIDANRIAALLDGEAQERPFPRDQLSERNPATLCDVDDRVIENTSRHRSNGGEH